MTKNVVLLARLDDPAAGVTLATFSTVQPVEHDPSDSMGEIIESALEVAGPVESWGRY